MDLQKQVERSLLVLLAEDLQTQVLLFQALLLAQSCQVCRKQRFEAERSLLAEGTVFELQPPGWKMWLVAACHALSTNLPKEPGRRQLPRRHKIGGDEHRVYDDPGRPG
jgi:hypothetical protein